MSQPPLTPATASQKAQILEMRRKDSLTSHEISQALGGNPNPSQVAAVIAWDTMRADGGEIAATPDAADALETTFRLERDLQRTLRANIEQLEPGLKTIDGGKERTVSFGGRIDILAEDRSGAKVVVELKAATADRDAIAQLLAYMGDLGETTPTVRGIVVAKDFAPATIAAARAAPKIKLLKYAYKFSFEAVAL